MGGARNRLARALRKMAPAPARAELPSAAFLETLERTGDVDKAAVTMARDLRRRKRIGRVRTVAMALQRNPGTATAGDICRAFVALEDTQVEFAWELLRRHDVERVLELAPTELFLAGFTVAPKEAKALLEQVRSGEIRCRPGARAWRAIANYAFAAGEEELSAWALDRFVAASGKSADAATDAARFRDWYGRRERRDELDEARPIAFALLDDETPERAIEDSPNSDEQRRLVLAELERVDATAAVHRYRVGRDATAFADVAQGTWLIQVGRLPNRLFGIADSLPFDSRYRPVFAAMRIENINALTEPALDQLRRCAPVGCGDWDTYYLMRAAAIPAFRFDDAPEALSAVVAHIVSGDDADAVYAAWRAATEPAVAAGIARDADVAALPPIGIDVAKACEAVRTSSVVIERSEPGPGGAEINLEFSLDGNLKHHMVIVLDSIVRRASRPIRLFVMCRDHDRADFDRLAERFPTVSFVWLPTDKVTYSEIPAQIRHITVATMDRLLLPELLNEVDRVIHHDLDAVCLTDIAELADVDLDDNPIAAVTTARTPYESGFREIRGTANRLREQGMSELARELIARTHLRHRFDYKVFNAGVMVLDLARMRADGFCREYFPYAERFGMNDQAILNAYAGAARLALDPEWNWCPRLQDYGHPRIAHWSGPIKPWGEVWVNGRELWAAAEAAAIPPAQTPSATAPAR